jgi:hypothetical protein
MERDMRKKLDVVEKVPYKRNIEEAEQADIFQFLAIITAFQTFFFKHKIFFWISIFCILSSFFNKRKNSGYSQYFMILMMLSLTFYSLYIQQPHQIVQNPPTN